MRINKALQQAFEREVANACGVNLASDAVGIAAAKFIKCGVLTESEIAWVFEQVYEMGQDTGRADFERDEFPE